MGLKIYTEPTEEPILLDEITKAHLRVDRTDEDHLIKQYITAARKHCESFSSRAFVTQTWELFLDSWPDKNYIELPKPPLQTVTHVKYKDTSGTLKEWVNTNYIVDTHSEPGRIVLCYGISWPELYAEAQNVQIRYICGYGAMSSIPKHIKQAILLKLTDLYEHRGDDVVDINIERAVEALLWGDRIVPV